MVEILRSHLSHPVLSFYRAQHLGQSWLASLAAVLDGCAVLIAGGDGRPAVQARLTCRMGVRLLDDLTAALGLPPDPRCRPRLFEADLPELARAANAARLGLALGPGEASEILRLARRYDRHLATLAAWLLIPLPSWTSREESAPETGTASETDGPDD
jgi:hypothetical protein